MVMIDGGAELLWSPFPLSSSDLSAVRSMPDRRLHRRLLACLPAVTDFSHEQKIKSHEQLDYRTQVYELYDVTFQEEYGDTMVPQKWSYRGEKLGRWVLSLRQLYSKIRLILPNTPPFRYVPEATYLRSLRRSRSLLCNSVSQFISV